MKMIFWDVFLLKLIPQKYGWVKRLVLVDSVPYDEDCDAWYVKHTLVNHDGYHPNIIVERSK